MGLEEQPGFLGWHLGAVAIHADWPNYPSGEGVAFALAALGRFPAGTRFCMVSDIDRCVLLVAEQYGTHADPFDDRAFHVAVWHEDLIDLAESGYVTGVQGLTEREYEIQERERMREDLRSRLNIPANVDPLENLRVQMPDGTYVRPSFRPLEDYEHDDEEYDFEAPRSWLGLRSNDWVEVTSEGFRTLDELWASELEIPERADRRIRHLLNGDLYDSALRDLGAMAETRMREIAGSAAFGGKLVEEFAAYLLGSDRYVPARVKILRGELRTAFKFIRNEFAHNLVDVPKGRAFALISLMCDLVAQLDEIAEREAQASD